ncbi:MAG: SCO family protein [Cellulophaga sp.]
MKNRIPIILLFIATITLISCNQKKTKSTLSNVALYQCPMQCEGLKIYDTQESCPICKMDLELLSDTITKEVSSGEISDNSIFNLTTKWNTEEGETIELVDLKGKILVLVMIYTSCKAACPRLVADMRNIEKQIPKEYKEEIQYVLVSIDPETDGPQKLKEFAKENLMDDENWTFLQGTIDGVREFANVLAIKYKEITPLDFSHSNIISVFNTQGELVHQQEGLGVDNKETIEQIKELVK